jgi:6-phosphofructokinase
MIRYQITGLYLKKGTNLINSTLDFNRKQDVKDVITNNLKRDDFDTIIIRRIEDD